MVEEKMMKIAIIGAPDSVKKIHSVLAEQNSSIEFVELIEEKVENTPEIVEKIQDVVDGIYVTGIGIYSLVKNICKKPLTFTGRNFPSIAKAFWDLRNDFNTFNNLKLGVDIVDKKALGSVLDELDISLENYIHQEFILNKTEKNYLDEYENLLEKKQINCIMTAFGHIYLYFKRKNIPVYRLQASNIEIIEKFEKLLKDIELKKNEDNSLGIKIIKIDNNEISWEDKEKINKIILEYSKEVQGQLKITDNKEYILITTKKMLKNKDLIWCFKKSLHELNLLDKGINLGIGIGFGESIINAEKNARKALGVSLEKRNFEIYSSSGKSIKGPLFDVKEIEYRDQVDEKIYIIAKKAGISSNYLSKIKAISKKYDKNEFTSKELANFLEISERSANRIIKSIMENGYGKLIEFENSIRAGRPRRVIKIDF